VATTGSLLCGHPPAGLSTYLTARRINCDRYLPAIPILNEKSLLCNFDLPSAAHAAAK